MTPDAVAAFASRDTSEQLRILRSASALDTAAGDALMGALAGMYPEKYAALVTALERMEVAA